MKKKRRGFGGKAHDTYRRGSLVQSRKARRDGACAGVLRTVCFDHDVVLIRGRGLIG